MTTNNSDIAAASTASLIVGAAASIASAPWWAPVLGVLGAILVPTLTRIINAAILHYFPERHELTPEEQRRINTAIQVAIDELERRMTVQDRRHDQPKPQADVPNTP
jgi:hypothetical protein